MPKLLSTREVASAIGVSEATVRRWDCPRVYVTCKMRGRGSVAKYDMEEVMAWLKGRSADTAKATAAAGKEVLAVQNPAKSKGSHENAEAR